MKRKLLQLRLEGADVTPETVDVEDLSALLVDYKKALEAAAKSLGTDVGDAILSLVSIRNGSEKLTLSISRSLQSAARELTQAIRTNDWNKCGNSARRCVQKMVSRLKPHAWSLTLPPVGRGKSAVLRADTPLTPPKRLTAKGETVLYGTVDDAGHEQRPRLKLVLDDKRSVVIAADREQAKQLGRRLFEVVAVRGIATWDLESGDITRFRMKGVEDFRETPLAEAFAALAEAAGSRWEGIDAREYVRELRGY